MGGCTHFSQWQYSKNTIATALQPWTFGGCLVTGLFFLMLFCLIFHCCGIIIIYLFFTFVFLFYFVFCLFFVRTHDNERIFFVTCFFFFLQYRTPLAFHHFCSSAKWHRQSTYNIQHFWYNAPTVSNSGGFVLAEIWMQKTYVTADWLLLATCFAAFDASKWL